jgi:hypothetical protein
VGRRFIFAVTDKQAAAMAEELPVDPAGVVARHIGAIVD